MILFSVKKAPKTLMTYVNPELQPDNSSGTQIHENSFGFPTYIHSMPNVHKCEEISHLQTPTFVRKELDVSITAKEQNLSIHKYKNDNEKEPGWTFADYIKRYLLHISFYPPKTDKTECSNTRCEHRWNICQNKNNSGDPFHNYHDEKLCADLLGPYKEMPTDVMLEFYHEQSVAVGCEPSFEPSTLKNQGNEIGGEGIPQLTPHYGLLNQITTPMIGTFANQFHNLVLLKRLASKTNTAESKNQTQQIPNMNQVFRDINPKQMTKVKKTNKKQINKTKTRDLNLVGSNFHRIQPSTHKQPKKTSKITKQIEQELINLSHKTTHNIATYLQKSKQSRNSKSQKEKMTKTKKIKYVQQHRNIRTRSKRYT